jgi:putative transposase
LCQALGVSTSGYYDWRERLERPARRTVFDEFLTEQIREIHTQSRGTYGSPRVHAELVLGEGIHVGQKRVERLMRQAGLEGIYRRKKHFTTRRDPKAALSDDLVNRQFSVDRPDVLWVGDVTEHPTTEGKVYLATVIDAFSRRVVGWSIADHLRAEIVVDALQMAIWRRNGREAGTVMHTDHGSQYTSWAFGRRLRAAGILGSMGSVGDALDKAMVSYCTPCRWLGGRSFVEADSLPFGVTGVAWGRWVEETDVLVVGLVGGDQAGALPGFDGGWVHVDPVGKFGDGEQSLGSESFEVAGQAVAAA